MSEDIKNRKSEADRAYTENYGIPPLKFKTHNDPDPHGKPRVYFCCHPDDFKLYFEEISEDILKYSDCAVYYCENGENLHFEIEERQSELKGMQLFVIPITTNLLTKPNIAVDKELSFAISEKIPVLPIMLERGLEDELYERKFKDLQYLDKNNKDATAIPFDEKLKKYLEGVLVGEELAEKVRAAFDAYIFLSYRKKDRRYAQELMKLIHKNDFCRDIAIWYDEFLVPGEGFNEAIQKALEKSKLFTLLVTPNLVNEKNYVMNNEYPMARDAGKKILPAKALDVDEKKLKAKFPGVPECIDIHKEKELSDALLSSLRNIVLLENDSNPQHNFFIGLAYLNGIDVEVNRERALKLITASAEAELPEAMEKLVSMYNSGEGVERDYEKAVEWQKKLAEFYESQYRKSGNWFDSKNTIYAYWHLGNFQYALRKLNDAEISYTKARRFSSEPPGTDESDELDETKKIKIVMQIFWDNTYSNYLSISLRNLGNIAQMRGNLSKAREYYMESLDLDRQLVKEDDEAAFRRSLADSLSSIGYIASAEGNLSKARKYYNESLEIRRQLAKETNTVQARWDWAGNLNNLGNIANAEGKLPEAREYYTESLEIFRQLEQETHTVEALRNLSICLNNLGNIANAEGKIPEAREYYTESLEIARQLAQETHTVDVRRNLSISLNKLGDIAQAEGKLPKARKYYAESLEIRRQLAQETHTVEARRDLAASLNEFGNTAEAEGNLLGAREFYTESFEIFRQLAEETHTVKARSDLSVILNNLGNITKAEGKIPEAREFFTESLEIRRQLVEETNTVQARRDLALSLNKLEDLAETEGNLSEAREYYTESLEIRRQLAEETNTVEARRDLAGSLNNLGRVAEAEGKVPEAREYYVENFNITQKLVNEMHKLEDYCDLANSLTKLANLERAAKNWSFSDEYFYKASEPDIKIMKIVRKEHHIDYNTAAIIFYNVAMTSHGFIKKAFLKKALKTWKKRTKISPYDPETKQYMEIAENELALLHKSRKKAKKNKHS